jgi:hypothetical protein
MLSIYVANENTNSLQKTGNKNIEKFQSYTLLNFGHLYAILDIRCYLESDKKIFSYELCVCPIKIQALIKKQNAKNDQNSR